jgi:hypothetical protein
MSGRLVQSAIPERGNVLGEAQYPQRIPLSELQRVDQGGVEFSFTG